jgi:uncharacterized RDD family membrane protein YckC
MSAAPKAAPANPFPGLRPYNEDEQHLFFGRERQVDRMIDKLGPHRFLAVVGGSGSGKSSLVNCGFKPALRRGLLAAAGTSWRMAQIRPGGNPIRALACELSAPGTLFENVSNDLPLADMLEGTLRLSSRGLVEIYRQARLPAGTNLLVVVDQFEELFRFRSAAGASYGPSPDTTAFIRLLLESAAQPDYPVYIALTMRSDFLGDCVQFDGLPEAINEGQYLVPRLTRDERRSVVEGPILSGGAVISPVLLTQLVNDVGDNPDQLSILQHALNRTWAKWKFDSRSQGPISLEHYEAIGTMARALDQHADRAWKELSTPRLQALCERAFKALTDRGTDQRGIRRPLRFANLCAIVDAADPAELIEVLKPFRKLSRSFVMPDEKAPIGPDTWIDISHESFMRLWTKLRDWADQEAESAREYRRLSDRAVGHFRHPEKYGLLQDPDLQSALDFETARHPTASWAELYGGGFDEVTRFLRESEKEREEERIERELERIWLLWWLPAISAFVGLAFLSVDVWLRDDLFPPPVQVSSNLDLTVAALDLAGSLFKVVMLATPFVFVWYFAVSNGKRLHRRFGRSAAVKSLVHRAQRQAELTAVSDPQDYAGWRWRALAFLIDFSLEFGIFYIVMSKTTFFSASFIYYLALTPLVTMLVLNTVFIASPLQATPGMLAVRIRVARLDGSRVSMLGALGRQLLKMLVSPGVLLWPLAYFAAQRQNAQIVRRKQWLGDLVSRTVVLNRPKRA